MSAVVKPAPSPAILTPELQADFLSCIYTALNITLASDVVFEFCDDDPPRSPPRKLTASGDRHANDFWYYLWSRPRVHACFGHYPTDAGIKKHPWEAGSQPAQSAVELESVSRRHHALTQALADERKRKEHQRRMEVTRDWEAAQPVPDNFGYLKQKGITGPLPVDWKLVRHMFPGGSFRDALMIPLRTVRDAGLVSAEYIAAEKSNDKSKPSRVSAYMLPSSKSVYIFGAHEEGSPIYVCEGIATAWTAYHISGCMTLRAGGASNLKAVAKDIRSTYGPSVQIVVCAERGNGYEQAVEAAAEVSGVICTPPFEHGDEGSDFNDYWLLSRHEANRDEATREALEEFQQPPSSPLIGTEDAVVQAFIDAVNRDYFVGLRWGGGTQIGRSNPDGTFSRIAKEDLSIALANRRVPGVRKSPHLLWLDHHDRREYREVAYDPERRRLDAKLDLNLWAGWPVVANSEGSWDLLKAHIRDNICAGEPRAYEYLMSWMAYVVQHPGRPSGVAVVLRGSQGCGKGTLFKALLQLFGRHGKHFNKAEHLTGSFTAHLEHVSFAFCDEVGWAGDHEFNDTLKALITEPRIQIHPKGKQMYDVPNTLNFGFATNREHAMHVTGDNRRMFVLEVHDAWADLFGEAKAVARERYFTALHRQLESGGYGAMLHDLMSMDLSEFRVDAFPRTRAAAEQVEMSLDSLNRYIVRLLREGVWRLVEVESEWVDGARVDKRLLYSDYVEFARGEGERYPAKEAQFWKRLRDITGDPWKQIQAEVKEKSTGERKRRRDVVLPSIQAARARAMPRLGVDT